MATAPNLAIAGVLALKFALPLAILRFPAAAAWANFVLDTVDGDILMPLGLSPEAYQLWDKTADAATYVAMLVVGRGWAIRRTVTVLFAVRAVGQVVYFASGNDLVFFWFPNFLEPLFLIYALLRYRDPSGAQDRYRRHLWLIWGVIVAFKMWNEWNTHVARIDLSELLFG